MRLDGLDLSRVTTLRFWGVRKVVPTARACPCPTQCPRPTFAEHLKRINRCNDTNDCSTTTVPYGQYLQSINDQNDLAARWAAINRTGSSESGRRDATRPPAAPINDLAAPPTPAASVPRLGDVPPTSIAAKVVTIEVAYQLRNLLSRGAIIDLVA